MLDPELQSKFSIHLQTRIVFSNTVEIVRKQSALVPVVYRMVNPGYSRVPATVHRFMTSSPKIASLASLTVRVDALETIFSLGYFVITTFTSASFSLLMTEEGSVLSGLTLLISIALGAAGERSGDFVCFEVSLG